MCAVCHVRIDPFGFSLVRVHAGNKNTDFFPSVNYVHALGSDSNLRLSYSTTVNRPEFRELAQFEFTDRHGQFHSNPFGVVEVDRARFALLRTGRSEVAPAGSQRESRARNGESQELFPHEVDLGVSV